MPQCTGCSAASTQARMQACRSLAISIHTHLSMAALSASSSSFCRPVRYLQQGVCACMPCKLSRVAWGGQGFSLAGFCASQVALQTLHLT